MSKLKTNHLLTGEELRPMDITALINLAKRLKLARLQKQVTKALVGHQLVMLFEKPSFRTRLSFAIAMQELGGAVVESISSTRKNETPEDQARVLNGYCHAIMVRTHEDIVLEKMRSVATIPIINGLSNLHHPCQVLGDLLTILEQLGQLEDVTVCYIGDGNNILHSLLLLAPQMGMNIHYACPPTRGPHPDILVKSLAKVNAHSGQIKSFTSPKEAVQEARVVYTDVWTSMGFEDCAADDLFNGFQVNEALMQLALPGAIFMHCLPMERGKEVSDTLPDHPSSAIFHQSENRLHIQKAILLHLLGGNGYE